MRAVGSCKAPALAHAAGVARVAWSSYDGEEIAREKGWLAWWCGGVPSSRPSTPLGAAAPLAATPAWVALRFVRLLVWLPPAPERRVPRSARPTAAEAVPLRLRWRWPMALFGEPKTAAAEVGVAEESAVFPFGRALGLSGRGRRKARGGARGPVEAENMEKEVSKRHTWAFVEAGKRTVLAFWAGPNQQQGRRGDVAA